MRATPFLKLKLFRNAKQMKIRHFNNDETFCKLHLSCQIVAVIQAQEGHACHQTNLSGVHIRGIRAIWAMWQRLRAVQVYEENKDSKRQRRKGNDLGTNDGLPDSRGHLCNVL